METLVETIVHLLNGINKNVVVFVISMCPILELRGGILAASKAFLDIPLHTALPISMIGNLIPIPFILYLIKKIFSLMKKSAFLRGKIERLEKRALSKSDKIQKYEFEYPQIITSQQRLQHFNKILQKP